MLDAKFGTYRFFQTGSFGMPDPVFHLTARAMAIVMGLAAVEPDPRAPDNDVLLDAALQAATGLAQLLRFRGACATAETAAEREAATACLLNAEAELTNAAEAVSGLLKLAKVSAAAGRTGASETKSRQAATSRGLSVTL
ncbi:MAG: hypothetical protein LC777_06985 [Actinobacteria bacterium]|nr:hypothetical protein [Actinomycetota bacterium]